jgi:hypothetical protein
LAAPGFEGGGSGAAAERRRRQDRLQARSPSQPCSGRFWPATKPPAHLPAPSASIDDWTCRSTPPQFGNPGALPKATTSTRPLLLLLLPSSPPLLLLLLLVVVLLLVLVALSPLPLPPAPPPPPPPRWILK